MQYIQHYVTTVKTNLLSFIDTGRIVCYVLFYFNRLVCHNQDSNPQAFEA